MSAEDQNQEINDDESSNTAKKSAKYDSGAADLEKVTDFVEQIKISAQDIGEIISSTENSPLVDEVPKKVRRVLFTPSDDPKVGLEDAKALHKIEALESNLKVALKEITEVKREILQIKDEF